MKHTPGPWEWKAVSGYDYGSTSYWVPKVCTNIDTEVNARLIAAAPEMLDTLQAVEFLLYDLGQQSTDEYQQVIAAITKATGEQP